MTSTRADCAIAERLAGAIALGEASDAQRDAYRRHLASCPECLQDLGGEREIERTMVAVAQAREEESWEPDLRAALARRRSSRLGWIWSAVLGVAVLVLIGLRFTEPPRSPVAVSHPAISASEARALAALNTQSVPRREGRAESLTLGTPLRSASIDLRVNEHGTPVRCTVTRSSGDRVLDQSICNVAMQRRYSVISH